MNRHSSLTLLLSTSLALSITACKPTMAPNDTTADANTANAAVPNEVAGSAVDATVRAREIAVPMPVEFDPAIPADLRSPPAESAGECGIEANEAAPQGSPLKLARTTPTQIEGWALLRESMSAPESVYLKLASNGDASYFVPVTMVAREGLGIRLGDAALDRAGFKVQAALEHVPAGEYTVQVAQRIDGRVLLCATGRTAVVTD